MKRKITNLCMLEISPRIYQPRDVSPVPVTSDYFVLTVGLQSAEWVGGTEGERKIFHFFLPNCLFCSVSSSIFCEITPLCFFLFLLHPHSPNCLLLNFLSLCPIFPYSSQTVCEMRGFGLPAWNTCGFMHQPIKKQTRAENADEKTQISQKIADVNKQWAHLSGVQWKCDCDQKADVKAE